MRASVLGSPRRRRRLGWAAACLSVAGAAAGAVVVVPHGGPTRGPEHFTNEPVQRPPEQVALRLRDRHAIDAVLARFVPTAVTRRRTAESYDLVTPTLRGGMSRAQWARGDIPVYPYPARGRVFRGWTVDASYPGDILLDVLLHPVNPTRIGPIAFTVEVKRIRGRWLVDSFVPTAVFTPTGGNEKAQVTSQADFTPNPLGAGAKPTLSPVWWAIPAGLGALVLLVPIGGVLASWRRDRRAFRDYERALAARF